MDDDMARKVGVAYLDAWRGRDEGEAASTRLDDALHRHSVPRVWLDPGRPREVLMRCWADGVPPSRIRGTLLAEVPEAVILVVRGL